MNGYLLVVRGLFAWKLISTYNNLKYKGKSEVILRLL